MSLYVILNRRKIKTIFLLIQVNLKNCIQTSIKNYIINRQMSLFYKRLYTKMNQYHVYKC